MITRSASFRIVSNAAGNATSAIEMLFVIAAVAPPTDIASPIVAAVQVGTPFQYTIVSSGGTPPLTYTAAPLPDGLAIDANSGVISGPPAAAGSTPIVITASNGSGQVSRTLTLTTSDTPPVVSLGAWRLTHFGASATDPAVAGDLADPDGDGVTNIDEYNAGTDPLDASSVPPAPLSTAWRSSSSR